MTQVITESERKRARRLLRHASPRSRWIDGVAGATGRALAAFAREAESAVGSAILGVGSFLYFVVLMIAMTFDVPYVAVVMFSITAMLPAYVASFLVYEEAERRDAEIHREGVDLVQSDIGKGIGNSFLFPSSESMDEWSDFAGTSDAAIVRNATMRLAALLALKGADTGERLEIARAAETVLSSSRRLAPPAMPKQSRSDRRIMGRIVGDGALLKRVVRTGDMHADEIAFIAQQALADDPDLVDAHGGRIDRLVEIDIPRLVAERDAALRRATEAGARSAQADYAHGIAAIERSIAEALDAWQAGRADALATRVRFLSQRRGEEFQRASAIAEPETPNVGGKPSRRTEGGIVAAIDRLLPRTRMDA